MTLAVEGYGSYIQMSPDGNTYTTVAEVTNIDGPGMKVKSLEAMHLQSPSNTAEFIPGPIDEGEVKLDLNFTKTQYAALRNTKGTVYYWKIVWSTGSVTGPGQGFVTDLSSTAPVDDKLKASCTIKATGVWPFAA